MSVPTEPAEATTDNPVLRLAQVNNSRLQVTIPFGWTTTLGRASLEMKRASPHAYPIMGRYVASDRTRYSRFMPRLPFTPGQITELISNVALFIEEQRREHAPESRPLSNTERESLTVHFPGDVLDQVRLTRVKHLQNPPFYPELEMMGFQNLPQFRRMAAVTFVDVIVAQDEFTPSLLFHELVHVVQYRELGKQKFAELYVRGFLDTGEYLSIPLERVAYHLEGLFRLRPDLAIEVEKQATAF